MFKVFNKDKKIDDIKLSLCKLMCNTNDTEELFRLIDIYKSIDDVYKGN